MDILRRTVYDITGHIQKTVEELDERAFGGYISILKEAHPKFGDDKRVFTIGRGRSGAVARMFTARLGQLGYDAKFAEDAYIPPLKKDDVVIAISGSGSTKGVVSYVRAAKEEGAKILAVTSREDSPLGKLADGILYIPGRRMEMTEEKSYLARQVKNTPMGTLFEDSTNITLDGVIAALREKTGETVDKMKKRHATVE